MQDEENGADSGRNKTQVNESSLPDEEQINFLWATRYNVFSVPLAAGVLYGYGILLSPARRSSHESEYCNRSYKCKNFKDGKMIRVMVLKNH